MRYRSDKLKTHLLMCLLMSFATSASSQVSDWGEEYGRRIKSTEAAPPLKDEAFGDQINLFNGTVSFSVTDISLPGNNALPVQFARTFDTQDVSSGRPIGEWDYAVPHLVAIHPAGGLTNWAPLLRCSTVAAPPTVGEFSAHEYWSGTQLHAPNGGGDLLSITTDPKLVKPATADVFKWTTKAGWFFSCLPTIKSGQGGEGFVGLAPDGSRTYFDLMVVRGYNGITKKQPHPYTGGDPPDDLVLYRSSIRLYASRVEDRFGNWVNYEWTGAQLMRIIASDGREIVFTYASDGRLLTAKAAGRVWTYEYVLPNNNGLASVLNPDGSRWKYAFVNELINWIYYKLDANGYKLGVEEPYCHWSYLIKPTNPGFTITHPSGASAQYMFTPLQHGQTNVPYQCFNIIDDGPTENKTSPTSDVMSLQSKRIFGPGMADQLTTYGYTSLAGGYAPKNPEADLLNGATPPPHFKTVTVTEPDGTQLIHTFGKDYRLNEGQLFSVVTVKAGVINRTVANSYVSETDVPNLLFPASMGSNLMQFADNFNASSIRPVKSAITSQDGATFQLTNNTYDNQARPLNVTRSSLPLGFSKTEATTYSDNLSKWVLGQVKTVTNTNTGAVISDTTYDANTALPTSVKSFGILQQSYTYNADGTLATVKDGLNHITTLTNWYRGLPRNLSYANGKTESAVVNDSGWITSATDENIYTTSYSYDAMGRLSKITYPTGDSVAWTATNRSFVSVAANEYGLPAGHWKQTVSTGNGKTTTYVDAMWRPVLVLSEDTGNVATRSYVVHRYDTLGREVFVSYPVATLTSVNDTLLGSRTYYDALGRVTRTEQDSELGVLASTVSYLTGFKKQVTNPRGFVTTTSYQAFDTPDDSAPTLIVAPLTATTTIARDVFGKPTSVTRSGTYNSVAVSAVRKYVYDANQRLCKTINPESGATLVDYNAAGNIAWSADGTALTGLTCDRASVTAGQKTTPTYDVMNRVTALATPGGVADLSTIYAADGLPTTRTAKNPDGVVVTSTYSYNKRRLLTGESISQPSWYTWTLGYAYNTNGHPSSLTYLGGVIVDYAPNALGQPTKVGTYATGVSYFPNGAVKSFTYGNGIVHTLTQNTRLLPSRSQDKNGATAILDDSYVFDANGNVTLITDQAQAGLTDRGMAYDGLDRLSTAVAPGMWGNASYTYDPLDNLRVTALGTSGYTYGYDSNNRLSTLTNTVGSVSSYYTDARGNITGDGKQAYQFDVANRLSAVTGKETYRYDALGRRAEMIKPDGTWLLFHYSQSGQLLFDQRAPNNLSKEYFYLGNSLVATRSYVWGTTNYTVTYQHTDALGTPVAVTNPSKAVLERTTYSPYGAPLNHPVDGVGYTGHFNDVATGLTYMQQRYYDPLIGRFLSVDPVTADGNSGGNFNRYWYANNNPYKFTDPDGRQSVGEMIDSGAAGCGAVSCAGWAVLSAAWTMTGAEPLSQVSDRGWSNVSTADKVGAVAAVAAVVPVGRIAGKVVEGASGVVAKTEVVQRAMSRAELSATESTGLLRGGREGTHYASDAVNSDALRARQRLALPQTPEVRATMEVPAGRFSSPSRVEPAFKMPGGGMERTASGQVPVRIIKVDKY